jgi:glutaredoxin
MEFAKPYPKNYTVYSKSGCHNCTKLKNFLTEKHLFFFEVQCDEYLIEERDNFLSFIEKIIDTNNVVFPMAFYDGKFIGNYNESIEHINKTLLSFEELF